MVYYWVHHSEPNFKHRIVNVTTKDIVHLLVIILYGSRNTVGNLENVVRVVLLCVVINVSINWLLECVEAIHNLIKTFEGIDVTSYSLLYSAHNSNCIYFSATIISLSEAAVGMSRGTIWLNIRYVNEHIGFDKTSDTTCEGVFYIFHKSRVLEENILTIYFCFVRRFRFFGECDCARLHVYVCSW